MRSFANRVTFRTRPGRRAAPVALLVGAMCAAAVPVSRASAGSPSQDCKRLASLNLPATTGVKTEWFEAGAFKHPAVVGVQPPRHPMPPLPAFCRVSAVARPSADSEIAFEVWLPGEEWNGRLWAAGNPNWAGSIRYSDLGFRLVEGYATVGTDTGHKGNVFDTEWASGHPEKVVDFGHRAIHEVTVRAKEIVAAYYGRKPVRSYFSSCSNGGRQALMEVQRYPNDYDGVIAGAPAYNWTHLMGACGWYGFTLKPSAFVPADLLRAIQAAAVAACDRLDGVEDGIIDTPQLCAFDPAVLACSRNEGHCLTELQLATVRGLYRGLSLVGGATLLHPYAPGSEFEWDDEPDPQRRDTFQFALGFFRDVVFHDPNWDFHGFDVERDTRIADAEFASILNATDPDLRKCAARGGKLILWHGWADGGVPPLATVEYYERVVQKIGEATARNSVRLFMVPGMGHCEGGPGPDDFGQRAAGTGDPGTKVGAALRRWVEDGVAPERIVATKRKDVDDPASAVLRTRPLCAYPMVARYRGQGSTDEAASFDCVRPPQER